MIKGIGVDIVDTRRIEALLQKYGKKVIDRLFTEKEQEKANKRTNKTLTYAKIFSAKEAFIKALGHSYSLQWQDIEILNNENGKPLVHLSSNGQRTLTKIIGKNTNIHLSLSDEPPYAIAFVTLETP
jgi:holo-[acyl-carrier protein] synthase